MNKTKSLPSGDLNYAGLIFCQFYLVNSTTTWMTSVEAVFFPLTPPATTPFLISVIIVRLLVVQYFFIKINDIVISAYN